MITLYPCVRRPLLSIVFGRRNAGSRTPSRLLVQRQPHISLYPFQHAAVDQIERNVAEGWRKLILVAPTGSGKTVIASELIRRYVANHRTVLFLAHRREIITQTSRKLNDNGVRHGIIMAGIDPRPMAPVQAASIDTLLVRGVRSKAMQLPPADLLIFDEAHRSRGRTREHLISLYPDAVLLGMTATPVRNDGRGLGNMFDKMVECPQVADLIKLGYLVGTKVYAPVDQNIAKGVRTQSGDYAVSQLANRMDTSELVGDIVSDWHKHSQRRKTVCFAVSVEHSRHICDEFIKAGVRAEHLDASTSIGEREAILARLASGETEVVSNCMVLTEGWDCPPVGCCILARPTRQMGLYRQMIGRVLRPADGKADAVVLDHSGAVFRHGLPEDRIAWTLDVDGFAKNPRHQARKAGEEPKLRKCPSCQMIMVSPPCGNCGWQPKPRSRRVDFAVGELGLVVGGKAKPPQYDPETRARWHGMLTHIAAERDYKPGWIAHKYKEKFGVYPPWGARPEPVAPTPEVRAWVKSRQIAFWRGGGRGAGAGSTNPRSSNVPRKSRRAVVPWRLRAGRA
jgi:DNA repair protein RadD